jgi:hypothetical protein
MTTHLASGTAPLPFRSAAGSRPTVWLEATLLMLLAAWLRTFWLDAPVHMDELYHVLASTGWVESGEPRIASGLYERSWLYTIFVGLGSTATDGPLLFGRLSSIVFGCALVGLVFAWLRGVAGSVAAWTAGLFLTFAPLAVELSQLARFYALHGTVFWLAAMALWRAVEGDDPLLRRSAIALAGLGLAVLAWHLQLVTRLGVVGGTGWAALMLAPGTWRRVRSGGRAIQMVAAGASLTAVLLAMLAVAAGLPQLLWQELRHAPGWALSLQNQAHFYHIYLLGQFPLFWSATAILGIAAIAFRPRAAAFCLMIFGTTLLLESLGGHKAYRYLYFALPFLFALWGLGVHAIWHRIVPAIAGEAAAAAAELPDGFPKRAARDAFVAATVLFLTVASGGPAQLLFHLAKGKDPIDAGRLTTDWQAIVPALRPWLEGADVVLTSNELAALHWLGRADLLVHGSRLSEHDLDADEGIDPRTGLLVIRTPDRVTAAIACHRSGVVILDDRDRGWSGVPDVTRAAIAAVTERLELPGVRNLQLFTWRHDQPLPACATPAAPGGAA